MFGLGISEISFLVLVIGGFTILFSSIRSYLLEVFRMPDFQKIRDGGTEDCRLGYTFDIDCAHRV